jgi:hypothetical protein
MQPYQKVAVAACFFFVAATDAAAASRICTSADTLLFGNRAVGTTSTLRSTVSNCGDAPFSFTGVDVHPATGPDYRVDTTCATGQTLGPGTSCSIDVTFAPRVTGQTSGALWLHNTTTTPDQLVTFYARGVDAQAGSAVIEFSPPLADFGTHPVGIQAGPFTLSLRNAGSAPLTPTALVINGPAAYDFSALSSGDAADCAVGSPIAPGASCRMNLFFRPEQQGARNASLVVDAPQLPALAITALTGTGTTSTPTALLDVVEFHHAPSGQYFITADAAEIAFLDAGGLGPDWQRTGLSFHAWPRDAVTVAIDVPACRFFGTPGVGPNSHFYTSDAGECAAVRDDPHWQYEGIAFRVALLTAAGCPAGYQTVERLWWPGSDPTGSRHRYLAAPAEVARMRAAGWIYEGPVFCAPQPAG